MLPCRQRDAIAQVVMRLFPPGSIAAHAYLQVIEQEQWTVPNRLLDAVRILPAFSVHRMAKVIEQVRHLYEQR